MGRGKITLPKLVERFRLEYVRLYGKKYGCAVAGRMVGKDRANVGELISIFGFDDLVARLRHYFADDDGWLVDRSHPLRVFMSKVDEYRVSRYVGKEKPNGARKEKWRKPARIAVAGEEFRRRWNVD